MKKNIFLISILFLVFTLTLLLGLMSWQYLMTPMKTFDTRLNGASETTTVQIKKGMSLKTVAQDLEKKFYIKNATWFVLFAKVLGKSNGLKVGEYQIQQTMTAFEILKVLTSGKSIHYSFTVSEGLNIFEIAQLFEDSGFGSKNDFLNQARNPQLVQVLLNENLSSFEGYLYPETYKITKNTTAQDLIRMMVKNFLKVYENLPQKSPMSRHQFVTFASLIEKESGVPEERPLIASVFFNRLKKNMRLQTDPTVLYGKALKEGSYIISITRADLRTPNPYNTYLNAGLPPGPISNPGAESFKALLRPATSNYLFFVSKNDGTHIFSETYEKHEKAVRQFQQDARARKGKSWRDYSNSIEKN
ncbi:MAG TPA: endolytic transglycosylase MltG [Pseudobdellovibrionaceae bacterium]|mgnify:CR=1 FL=1|nr:endolytic transglycosylase MltG [Pseudobdellovibrionaceae bacterium]